MKGLFLGLVLAHTVHAVFMNWREVRAQPSDATGTDSGPDATAPPRRRKRLALIIQLPVFYIACYFAYRQGMFSRELVSPIHIGLGLLAGHMVFGISLLITHNSLSTSWEHFIDLGALWDYALESPVILGRFILVAFAEEVIWRVAAQPILVDLLRGGAAALIGPAGAGWGVAAAILLVAVLFSIAHKHFFQNTLLVSVEFLGFAILLGLLYYWTTSFILVIVIHALRDVEIAYLEYLIKVEELGDKELAAKEIERSIVKYPRPENP